MEVFFFLGFFFDAVGRLVVRLCLLFVSVKNNPDAQFKVLYSLMS